MTSHHLKGSIVVSTFPLALDLPGFRTVAVEGFHFGHFTQDLVKVGAGNRFAISLETMLPCLGGDNSIVVEKGTLTVTGSEMNTEAIYYFRCDDRIAVFNDLFLAHAIICASGREPRYSRALAADLVFFEGLSRLPAGVRMTSRLRRTALEVVIDETANILERPRTRYLDLEESKLQLATCLTRAVEEGIGDTREVHLSLSGGIDSGTIAALIRARGARISAYTLGTDWGHEYQQARETADHLGIMLEQVHVTTDELLYEIPAVIRFFHFVHAENIEIALVAHCLYKKLHDSRPERRLFLTGYGSDLLNAGGIASCDDFDALQSGIFRELARTQRSNEFSGLAARSYGVVARHPYWHPDVISCALRVPPSHKVRGGQDKVYLREMMRGRLPDATIGRAKLGAHHGTGLNQHLAAVFDGPTSYRDMIDRVHRDIFSRGDYSREGAP